MRRAPCILLLLCVAVVSARAQVLHPLGPTGGGVQAFGQDPANPQRVFLGTADGHVFGSEDGGAHWQLLGRAGRRGGFRDYCHSGGPARSAIPFCFYVDARTRPRAAACFRSGDGGRTWTSAGLTGRGGPGARDGAFVAGDARGGNARRRLSHARCGAHLAENFSEDDAELRNLDSLALDPKDPNVIYAGTFHLPWKTTDGGLNWHSIHTGMIDDSDVMSILVDRAQPGPRLRERVFGYLSQR